MKNRGCGYGARVFAFFVPKYLKEGRIVVRHARKILRYKRDILPEERLAALNGYISDLQKALADRDVPAVKKAREVVEKEFIKVPGAVQTGWQENTEVIIVAIVIALGVRAYFLQPFKIPTGSMQPTLNGIIGHKSEAPAPNALVQLWERVVIGRHYLNVRAVEDDEIRALIPRRKWFFLGETEVVCAKRRYVIEAELDTLNRDFGLPYVDKTTRQVLQRIDQNGLPIPYRISKGDALAVGYIETGDQVFVDKMSYHFFPPGRSEVFVFKTTGIKGIPIDAGMGSQHYIKRLAGVPGDELRIDPPRLFHNGVEAVEPGFRRVMSATNGFRGYGSGPSYGFAWNLASPSATFTLAAGEYFALGDNSYSSSDGRFWGVVRERNIVGRGLSVYYPFNNHWGVIR